MIVGTIITVVCIVRHVRYMYLHVCLVRMAWHVAWYNIMHWWIWATMVVMSQARVCNSQSCIMLSTIVRKWWNDDGYDKISWCWLHILRWMIHIMMLDICLCSHISLLMIFITSVIRTYVVCGVSWWVELSLDWIVVTQIECFLLHLQIQQQDDKGHLRPFCLFF